MNNNGRDIYRGFCYAAGKTPGLFGEDVKMVSQRLGHTSVAFTLDTYHHVLPGVGKEAVMRFDSLLQS